MSTINQRWYLCVFYIDVIFFEQQTTQCLIIRCFRVNQQGKLPRGSQVYLLTKCIGFNSSWNDHVDDYRVDILINNDYCAIMHCSLLTIVHNACQVLVSLHRWCSKVNVWYWTKHRCKCWINMCMSFVTRNSILWTRIRLINESLSCIVVIDRSSCQERELREDTQCSLNIVDSNSSWQEK
jgi:hypothetical protein